MRVGWVKLWRQSVESPVFGDPPLWQLWCFLLMRASHKQRTVLARTGRGTTTVELQPGQLIVGRNSLAEKLGVSSSSARRRLAKLDRLGMLTIQPSRHFSIVTIENWATYQRRERSKGQATGQAKEQPTGQPSGQPKASQADTKKNGKNVKKEKNEQEFMVVDEGDQLEVWGEARDLANRKVLPVLGKPKDERDRSLVLKAAKLSLNGRGEYWINNAIEGVRHTKPDNRYGYFYKLLAGDDKAGFERDLARLEVPSTFLQPRPKQQQNLSQRLCVDHEP